MDTERKNYVHALTKNKDGNLSVLPWQNDYIITAEKETVRVTKLVLYNSEVFIFKLIMLGNF